MKRKAPIFLYFIFIFIILTLAFFTFGGNDFIFLKEFTYYALLFVSFLVLMVSQVLSKMLENEKFKKLTDAEKQKYLIDRKTPYLKWLYNDAFAKRLADDSDGVEILDHGFDGITELDNQLPRWWLGLFYFGICSCIVYIFSFFTTDFAHPIAELDKQTTIDTIEINRINALTPQVTFEDIKFEEGNIEEGKILFSQNCASCHKANGAGGIGPNLTDDEWINVMNPDLFKNIAYMPWYGSKNNPTMRSFINSGELKGKAIEKIVAYIYHINQDIPNAPDGAAPQGKIVKEWAKDPIPAGVGVVSSVIN